MGPEIARIDALVFRLAGAVALVAAGMLLTCLAAVTRFPSVSGDQWGAAAYALPGTHHAVDAAIVPILAWCGGGAALLGLTCLGLSRLPAGAFNPMHRCQPTLSPSRRPLKRPFAVLTAGFGLLVLVLILRR